MNKLIFFIFISFLSHGCMLGPKKELPPLDISSTFREQGDLIDNSEQIEKNWWKKFNDPLLDEFILCALSKNYNLRSAREKVKELRATYRMDSGKLWPSISAFGTLIRYKRSQDALGFIPGDLINSLYIAGFDASWEIDFFGKNRSAKQAAYFDVLSSEENVHSTQVTVISEVARIYTNIRALQQRIHVLEKRIEAQEKIYSITESLVMSGIGDELLLESQKSDLSQDKSQLPQLVVDLKQAIYQLTFLLGKNPGELTDVLNNRMPIPKAEGKIPVGLPSDLLRNRPDIKIAEMNYYSACARIGEAKADLFPNFSLTGSWLSVAQKASNLFSNIANGWFIIPSIDWNLFNGWQTLSNIKIKNSQQKQSLITYEQTVASALTDVESSLCAYVEDAKNLQLLKQQLLAKKKICELNQYLFSSGIKEVKEYLLSLKDFYSIQDEYLQSKERFMADLISVYKSLGGGWDETELLQK